MGESKDNLIRQEIADEENSCIAPTFGDDTVNRGNNHIYDNTGCCVYCGGFQSENNQQDPDHLNPSKGGNQASDDYW